MCETQVYKQKSAPVGIRTRVAGSKGQDDGMKNNIRSSRAFNLKIGQKTFYRKFIIHKEVIPGA